MTLGLGILLAVALQAPQGNDALFAVRRVAGRHQRHGRGTAMLTHLLELARQAGVRRMLLEVRPGNLPGQALYRRHGFVEIGRRRDYYPAHGGREDAIVMACEL